MAYITGTLNSVNPSLDLYNLVAPAMVTAGYTLVDTVVITTRTHKIWKSPATNIHGVEWFCDVTYVTTGAGHLYFTPYEFYDPATDLAYRGPTYGNVSGTPDAVYNARYGASGFSLEHANWGVNPALDSTYAVQTSLASGFGYWISVTIDRVLALTTLAPTGIRYCGLYEQDPIVKAAVVTVFPLISAIVGGGSNASNGSQNTQSLTRYPGISFSVNFWDMLASTTGSEYQEAIPTNQLPAGSTATYGGRYAWRVPVKVRTVAMTYAARWGHLYDVLAMPSTTAISRGDTLTVGADTWVLATYWAGGFGAANICNFFKAV